MCIHHYVPLYSIWDTILFQHNFSIHFIYFKTHLISLQQVILLSPFFNFCFKAIETGITFTSNKIHEQQNTWYICLLCSKEDVNDSFSLECK